MKEENVEISLTNESVKKRFIRRHTARETIQYNTKINQELNTSPVNKESEVLLVASNDISPKEEIIWHLYDLMGFSVATLKSNNKWTV